MKKRNRFFEGVILGAIIGGAYTLCDQETRTTVLKTGKETIMKTAKMIQNPLKITEDIKKGVKEITATYQQMKEDIAFVTEKAHELKELTPQMIEILKDTKEILTNDKKEQS